MDNRPSPDAVPGRCAEVQEVLFAYMSRELGAARSDFVREHLRRCPDCQREAAAIQTVLDALRAATPVPVPERLSEERRALIRWTFMHPVRDWIHRHHAWVSLVIALIVLAATFFLLRKVVDVRRPREPSTPEVWIGRGPPPTTP